MRVHVFLLSGSPATIGVDRIVPSAQGRALGSIMHAALQCLTYVLGNETAFVPDWVVSGDKPQ
jgi:hypothetical protein